MTTTNSKIFKDMGNFLSDLSRRSDKFWKGQKTLGEVKVPGDTWENYYKLMELKYQMTEGEIRAEFEKNAHMCSINFDNLYLPPLENNPEFVPILSVKCDLKEKDDQISLRVEMLRYDTNQKLNGFGYRFESPHPNGNHNYWHIQVISGGMKLGCPEWLPENDPCIPLRIETPIGLILIMLICFYGRSGIDLINNMDIDTIYKKSVYDIYFPG